MAGQHLGRNYIGESGKERSANARLMDDFTDPTTNEGNLLSLITLKQIVGETGGDGSVNHTLRAMAKEETRHLMLAMRILTASETGPVGDEKGKGNKLEGAALAAAQKLQDKFGRDMNGAIKLGKLLKAKGDSRETELMLQPFVNDTITTKDRAARGGFSLGNAGPENVGKAFGNAFT